MKTTTLYKYIQSELINKGFNEYVDSDGHLVFFDEEHQFMTKIFSYDEDIKKIVNNLFASQSLENVEHDEHFKKTFLYRFINRYINRQTIESFKLELLSTFMSNQDFINRMYKDIDDLVSQTQIGDNKSKQTNSQVNDGTTVSDNRSAFADLPQSSINLDVENAIISSATDNTVSKNKQKNTQKNDGETISDTTSINKTYSIDELLKTHGLLEQILNNFDVKCFSQIWWRGDIMGKPLRGYKVNKLNDIKTSKYEEGDFFITDKSIGVIVNGKIKVLSTGTPNLKNYVKKDEIEKILENYMKKVK